MEMDFCVPNSGAETVIQNCRHVFKLTPPLLGVMKFDEDYANVKGGGGGGEGSVEISCYRRLTNSFGLEHL